MVQMRMLKQKVTAEGETAEFIELRRIPIFCTFYQILFKVFWFFLSVLPCETASPEGASLHILSTQSHMDAIFKKRPKGHVLSQSPVHLSVLHQIFSATQDTGHTWTNRQSHCKLLVAGLWEALPS